MRPSRPNDREKMNETVSRTPGVRPNPPRTTMWRPRVSAMPIMERFLRLSRKSLDAREGLIWAVITSGKRLYRADTSGTWKLFAATRTDYHRTAFEARCCGSRLGGGQREAQPFSGTVYVHEGELLKIDFAGTRCWCFLLCVYIYNLFPRFYKLHILFSFSYLYCDLFQPSQFIILCLKQRCDILLLLRFCFLLSSPLSGIRQCAREFQRRWLLTPRGSWYVATEPGKALLRSILIKESLRILLA